MVTELDVLPGGGHASFGTGQCAMVTEHVLWPWQLYSGFGTGQCAMVTERYSACSFSASGFGTGQCAMVTELNVMLCASLDGFGTGQCAMVTELDCSQFREVIVLEPVDVPRLLNVPLRIHGPMAVLEPDKASSSLNAPRSDTRCLG